jgi:hypothetical protein
MMYFVPSTLRVLHPAFAFLMPIGVTYLDGGGGRGSSSTVRKQKPPKSATRSKSSSKLLPKSTQAKKRSAPNDTPDSVANGTRSRSRAKVKATNLLDVIEEGRRRSADSDLESSSSSEISRDLLGETQEVPSTLPPLPSRPPRLPPAQQMDTTESQDPDDISTSSGHKQLTGASPTFSPVNSTIDEQEEDEYMNGTDNFFGTHDPAFDMSMEERPFLDRLIHFMRGKLISEEYRKSVEIAILCEANKSLTEAGQMEKDEQDNYVLNTYVTLVRAIPEKYFSSPDIKAVMISRRKGAQEDLDGKNLRRQYRDFRKQLRKTFANLPVNFSTIPSGKQLYDIVDRHICEIYADVNVSGTIFFVLVFASCISISYTLYYRTHFVQV